MAKTQPNTASTSPVHTLREQVTALEAAMELTFANPKKEPVHRLRTTTRRIEAQLELLTAMAPDEPRLAGLSRAAKKAGKLLKALRRSAGKVRDLDVQRALVEEAVANGAAKRVRKEAKELRASLKADRRACAETLLAELEGHAKKLAPRLEVLLDALEQAEAIALTPKRVTALVRDWYRARVAAADATVDGLHARRKAAKLARYMLENSAPALAGQYEELQEVGGEWHDALTLERLIREELGKDAGLREIFRERKVKALTAFRERLDGFEARA